MKYEPEEDVGARLDWATSAIFKHKSILRRGVFGGRTRATVPIYLVSNSFFADSSRSWTGLLEGGGGGQLNRTFTMHG